MNALALALRDYRNVGYEYTPDGYGRAVLERSAERELVAIHWPRGVASPLHGHGGSRTWLRLISGEVLEERFLPSNDDSSFLYLRSRLGPGGESELPAGAFHRVEAIEETFAVHVYAPVLIEPAAPVPAALMRALRRAFWSATPDRPALLPDYLR